MVSPASTSTTLPTFSSVDGTSRKFCRSFGPDSSFAWVSVRWRRSVSACALPRPSATASAKLANSTVNHSQMMIWNSNRMCSPPVRRSRIRIIVVNAVTISRTNITGFLISVRGLSLAKDETIAGSTIFGSSSADTGMVLRWAEVSIEVTPGLIGGEQCAGVYRELLDDRAERQRRKEGETANNHDH